MNTSNNMYEDQPVKDLDHWVEFVKELNQLNLSLPIDHHELYRALSSKYQIRKR